MQAVLAILANKPSSGGFECDLGSLSDVLAPKRSSLRVDLVEINMFFKINKHLIPTNPAKVAPLDKKMNWENNIPKRPVMALYDGGEEEEKEEEDTDDDNDNFPIWRDCISSIKGVRRPRLVNFSGAWSLSSQ